MHLPEFFPSVLTYSDPGEERAYGGGRRNIAFYIKEICGLCFTFVDSVSYQCPLLIFWFRGYCARFSFIGRKSLRVSNGGILKSSSHFEARFQPLKFDTRLKMQFSVFVLLVTGCVIISASLGTCDPIRPAYERSETMSRPTRPKIFSTPEELKSYLEELGNFYAIAGRPRFGKRTLAPWMANYMREDPAAMRNLPISNTDLLQMLSSIPQNQDK